MVLQILKLAFLSKSCLAKLRTSQKDTAPHRRDILPLGIACLVALQCSSNIPLEPVGKQLIVILGNQPINQSSAD